MPIASYISSYDIILNSKNKHISLKIAVYPDIGTTGLSLKDKELMTDDLWSLLRPLYPDTLIKGDYTYLHSILDALQESLVWSNVI